MNLKKAGAFIAAPLMTIGLTAGGFAAATAAHAEEAPIVQVLGQLTPDEYKSFNVAQAINWAGNHNLWCATAVIKVGDLDDAIGAQLMGGLSSTYENRVQDMCPTGIVVAGDVLKV